MNIIGLGNGGCTIADLFSEYPEYKVFKIDVGLKGKNCFKLPLCKTIEEYEETVPEFKKLSNIKGDTLFIMCGGGNVSGCSLKLLEKIKHVEPSVLFIRPDPSLVSDEMLLKEKITFGILQEYARSGLLKKIMVISNGIIEELLDGLSILSYHNDLNKMIVATIHMINYLLTTDAIFGKMTATRDSDRICTVGIYNIEEQQEVYLYNLNCPIQKVFLYGIKEKDLTENKDLIRMIQQQTKNASTGTELDISYKITMTNYESNFAYIISNTNIIQ